VDTSLRVVQLLHAAGMYARAKAAPAVSMRKAIISFAATAAPAAGMCALPQAANVASMEVCLSPSRRQQIALARVGEPSAKIDMGTGSLAARTRLVVVTFAQALEAHVARIMRAMTSCAEGALIATAIFVKSDETNVHRDRRCHVAK